MHSYIHAICAFAGLVCVKNPREALPGTTKWIISPESQVSQLISWTLHVHLMLTFGQNSLKCKFV